jgi:hypothetical protein
MRWSPLQVQGSIQMGQVGGGGGVVNPASPKPSSAAATSISVVAKTLAAKSDERCYRYD